MSKSTTMAIIATLTLASCSSGPRAEGRPYPELDQVETVNIQVFVYPETIELTNTTARSFGPSTLWLNGRFSRDIDGLEVGERLTIGLTQFVDEFGRPVRSGGFFSTQIPDNIVLSQIQHEGELVGLVTINRTTQ